MAVRTEALPSRSTGVRAWLARTWAPYRRVPLLGWIASLLAAVLLERFVGTPLVRMLGMSKVPSLLGVEIALKTPALIPSALLFVLLIYLIPMGVVARLITRPANRAAAGLLRFPTAVSALLHVGLIYLVLALWADQGDYRVLVARLAMINIILTLSLNVINGYMGEFSCSHPGFMALGAYASSVFIIVVFIGNDTLGGPLLPPSLGRLAFPLGLVVGGAAAAIGALLVAIPSFRTRGDYLAIISLAFMFIVKSLMENLEMVGGARGLPGQPAWATLPVVFSWTILCIWIINNFVRSILGKALNAVRDGELGASAMTVDTRKTKMTAFLFGAFWAGVAGGLFAFILGYINPGMFGIQKLAELLAMVYFGGLNSVVGSIVGAVGLTVLSEVLRPLEIFKWIIIPVMLILIMIFRPTGLIAFREFDIGKIIQPKDHERKEVDHGAA